MYTVFFFFATFSRRSYIIIIEWNGKKKNTESHRLKYKILRHEICSEILVKNRCIIIYTQKRK